MKNPQNSTLLSPTSSKLMTQYIVKANLNHHYSKLQNAKPRIDNSLPDSMLKSQKVRDRKRQEGQPYYTKSSQRSKSRQSSRPQSQFSNSGDSKEYWMDKYGDDLEAEVERIVQMTLNGRSQELQHVSLYAQHQRDSAKQLDATYQETVRSRNHDGHFSSLSRSCVSPHSLVSNSEKLVSDRRAGMSARSENQDLLKTRAHMFTEPDKPFVPKILKSNRSSLLNHYKYYNAPKRQRERQSCNDNNASALSFGSREDSKGEVPVPKPRQKANLGNTQTLTRKSDEGDKRVPPLDISADEDKNKFFTKKSTPVLTRSHVKLSDPQSLTDLPHSSGSFNKSQSLRIQGGQTKDEVKLASDHKIAEKNARKKRHMTLTSGRGSRTFSKTEREEETDHTEFLKDVTDEILMKGLYTNRSIQRVFDAHARKRKDQLNEVETRKLFTKLQKDLDLAKNDVKVSPKRIPSSSLASVEVTRKDPDQDAVPLSPLILKEYEEKIFRDENSPITSEVHSSTDDNILRASDEDDLTQKAQEVEELKNTNVSCEKPGNDYEDGSLVEEKTNLYRKPVNNCDNKNLVGGKTKNVTDPLTSDAPKPIPRPRQVQTEKDQNQDAISVPPLMPKENEKVIRNESFPVASKVQSSMDDNAFRANYDNDQIEKVQESELLKNTNGNCKTLENNYGDESIFDSEKAKNVQEQLESSVPKPVPRPRPRRKSSTTNFISSITSSELLSDATLQNSDPKSTELNGTAFQSSVISGKSASGTTSKEHSKVSCSSGIRQLSDFDSEQNLMENKKKNSLNSLNADQKENEEMVSAAKEEMVSPVKSADEDEYNDDFEDDDDDDDGNVDMSDSDF